MARIVFRYPEMQAAANAIRGYADDYKAAAVTLETNLDQALTEWKGDSKEKFMSYITGAVHQFTHTDVFNMVTSLAELLDENAKAMQQTDLDLAGSMPTSL